MNSKLKENLTLIQDVANEALELHKNSTEKFSGVNYGDLQVVDVYVKYSIHEEDSANYGVLIEECSPTADEFRDYMLEYLYKNLPDLGGCIYVELEW
jgi:hypothetical protein